LPGGIGGLQLEVVPGEMVLDLIGIVLP